ncbi:MAG TPA: phosphatidylglycerophosphatase A [Candidatus Binatia bacterium]|nr:phosphatidylglycerophosphatase A [Candidatus Binatia bacterium]
MRSLTLMVATVGGVGNLPLAPGTFGSLVVVPLLPSLAALRDAAPPVYALAVAALVAVAIWSAGRAEELLGGHDHSRIVVDEVAGMVVAGAWLPGTWGAAGVAFLLFRLFDVLKPFPAGFIDGRVEGGFGVVGDDLVAGLYAGVATRLLLGVV